MEGPVAPAPHTSPSDTALPAPCFHASSRPTASLLPLLRRVRAPGSPFHAARRPHARETYDVPNRKTLYARIAPGPPPGRAAAGRTVVHCHGCFDIVHPGHIQHLQFARSLGDVLVVSVSGDSHVNKGVDRPLIPDDLRAVKPGGPGVRRLGLRQPGPDGRRPAGALRPDVYVKGREYEKNLDPRFLAERDAVLRHGGRVVFSSGEVVYSSTALIARLGRARPVQRREGRPACASDTADHAAPGGPAAAGCAARGWSSSATTSSTATTSATRPASPAKGR